MPSPHGCSHTVTAPSWLALTRATETIDRLIGDTFGERHAVTKQDQRARDPHDDTDHQEAIRDVLRRILEVVDPVEERATHQMLRALEVDWASLSPDQRDRTIARAMQAVMGVPDAVVPRIGSVLQAAGRTHVVQTKQALNDRYDLSVDPHFSAVDRRVIDHMVSSQALYIRDQYGKREVAYSSIARRIAARGVEQGLDKDDIAAAMKKAFQGTSAERSESYYRMVATVFMGRARSYSTVTGFVEAGIEASEWSSARTEETCFAAGTMIEMADGTSRPIEAVSVGERVVSCKGAPRRVARVFRFTKRHWLRLTFSDGRSVVVTPNHPMLTDHGWERAGYLVERARVAYFSGDHDRLRRMWETPSEEGRTADCQESILLGGMSACADGMHRLPGTDRVSQSAFIGQESPQDVFRGVSPIGERATCEGIAPVQDLWKSGVQTGSGLLFHGLRQRRAGLPTLREDVQSVSAPGSYRAGHLLFDALSPNAQAKGLFKRGPGSHVRVLREGDSSLACRTQARNRAAALLQQVPHQGSSAALQDLRDTDLRAQVSGHEAVLLSCLLHEAWRGDGLGGEGPRRNRTAATAIQTGSARGTVDGGLRGQSTLDRGSRRGVLALQASREDARRKAGRGASRARIHGRAAPREDSQDRPDVHRTSLPELRPVPASDLADVGRFIELRTIERWVESAPAFDLQIESEPGYLANGLVVHNCDACRFLDGKVFNVHEQQRAFFDVMGSDDPEEVQFRQPFMSRGKDGDGEYLYFKGRDGARQEVARVEESGVGRQEAGKYRQTMSDKQMSGHGVNAPPLHGHCFCLLIPAGLDAMADMGRPAPRTPHQAPADTWPHPHLPPHGHVEAIPYQPAPPPEPEPVKTPAKKPTPSLNFDDLARKVPLTEVKPLTSLGQENVNPVFTARLGKTAVYVKPGHIHFDPADAVARHRAVADTARALGAEQMVMPAALVRSEEALREAGRVVPELLDRKNFVTPSMFVTQAAPAGAVPAYAQAPQALAKVREADRLSGALVDFLHANGDRHDGNVLVDDRGHLFLIDHDLTASTDATSSVFFPGGGLSYAQRQRSLSDLPAALRAHVSEVAETDVDALSQTYSLSEEAAAAMKKRAQDVVRKGLDAALSEHGAWWQSVGPDALERSGEVVPR